MVVHNQLQVANATSVGCDQAMPHARVVNLDAEEVAVSLFGRHCHERFAIAEADLQHDGRAAPE